MPLISHIAHVLGVVAVVVAAAVVAVGIADVVVTTTVHNWLQQSSREQQ